MHVLSLISRRVREAAGGSTNRYGSGRSVTFERISGHRDGNSTACPGGQLYAQLPRIRELAAGRAPALATGPALISSATIPVGAPR